MRKKIKYSPLLAAFLVSHWTRLELASALSIPMLNKTTPVESILSLHAARLKQERTDKRMENTYEDVYRLNENTGTVGILLKALHNCP